MEAMKAYLKTLAVKITSLKATRKQCRNGFVPDLSTAQSEFRHKHITLCLAWGKTYSEIENTTVRLGNEPSLSKVGHMYKELTGTMHPNFICDCEACM